MVRQHDAAGADANRRRAAGDMRDDNRRRRARDRRHVVMLGQPVAVIAPRSACRARSSEFRECLRGRCCRSDRGEVENRARNHTDTVSLQPMIPRITHRRGTITGMLLGDAGGTPGSGRQLLDGLRPAAARHVVLISLDGFPSWALDDPLSAPPTLRGWPRAARARRACAR